MKGLEPLLLSKPDPKSGASTNSATPAKCVFEGAKIRIIYLFTDAFVANVRKNGSLISSISVLEQLFEPNSVIRVRNDF